MSSVKVIKLSSLSNTPYNKGLCYRFMTSYKSGPTVFEPELLDIPQSNIWSQEHDVFRERVRRFFHEEVAPQKER